MSESEIKVEDNQTYFNKEFDVDTTIKENKKNNAPKTVKRELYHMDAIDYIKNNEIAPSTSIVTSLPDIVEMSGYTLEAYKQWFVEAVRLITSKLTDNNVAIFYQTDIRIKVKGNKGLLDEYIDKGYMCMKGAELGGCKTIFHKIMTSAPLELEKVSRGTKSGYTHMICFGKKPSNIIYQEQTPDVANRGGMVWTKGMGLRACQVATRYIRNIGSTTVLDMFCGKGSTLAMANYIGLNSIGVDLAISKVRHSLNLVVLPSMVESFQQSDWKSQKESTETKETNELKETKETNETTESTTITTTSITKNENVNDKIENEETK